MVSAVVLGVIGVLSVMTSSAAIYAVHREAEAGGKAGKAVDVGSAQASGATAVIFGGTGTPSPTGCVGTPGAPAGSPVKPYSEYSANATVSNVIFDASTDDDMVNVTGGTVVFDHVTFRGRGTGSSGSSLEVSGSGGVEVRNSVFEGAPTEDYIQTKGSGTSLIECNLFKNKPGEDDIDMKSGGAVTVRNNTVQVVADGGDSFIMQNSTSSVTIENNSGPGLASIFFTNDAHGGTVTNNVITAGDSTLWVYDVSDILIQGNEVSTVRNGESGSGRQPSSIYYLNNKISTFQFNGGSCYRTGNTGAALSGCTDGAPAWYRP